MTVFDFIFGRPTSIFVMYSMNQNTPNIIEYYNFKCSLCLENFHNVSIDKDIQMNCNNQSEYLLLLRA